MFRHFKQGFEELINEKNWKIMATKKMEKME